MATKAAAPKPVITPRDTQAKTATLHRMPRTLAGNAQPSDADRKAATALFEKAVKLVHAGKYSEAHEVFDQMLGTAPAELGASIRMYIDVCVGQQIQKKGSEFSSPEERYDYAIVLLNDRLYEDAREHLDIIRKEDSHADYAFYGLALLASMTGETEECLKHLSEAIRLNPQNRLQARADSDFANVADDPSFTELLYPDA